MAKKTRRIVQWIGNRLHLLGMLSLILPALLGMPIEASAGLLAYPPKAIELPTPFEKRSKKTRDRAVGGMFWGVSFRRGFQFMRTTSVPMILQSGLLCLVWKLSNGLLPALILTTPLVKWILLGISTSCPWLGNQPEMRCTCWAIEKTRWLSLLILTAGSIWQLFGKPSNENTFEFSNVFIISFGGIVEKPIEVVEIEEEFQIKLKGEFNFRVDKSNSFWLRIVILFLRQLTGPIARHGSRATRDGRRPLLSQQELASCFEVTQPEISRWEKWWLAKDWANLLSLHSADHRIEKSDSGNNGQISVVGPEAGV